MRTLYIAVLWLAALAPLLILPSVQLWKICHESPHQPGFFPFLEITFGKKKAGWACNKVILSGHAMMWV